MKHLPHIGTTVHVSLLGDRYTPVPAKVDTGADSSSVWASGIVEDAGKLSFVLFDTTSPFYDGKVITTSDYKVISVRNSFGQSEFRYKTHLTLKIDGHQIRAHVTLADRGGNRYPVLIGRRTLSGKFLVDVSRRSHKPVYRVLMLSSKHTEVTDSFAKNIEKSSKRKLSITYATYQDLRFEFNDPTTRVVLRQSDEDIAGFDMVHFKVTAGHLDIAAAAAQYLDLRGVPFIDQAIKYFPSTSKLYQYAWLERSDLIIPSTIFLLPVALAESFEYLQTHLGLPFILKDIHGNKGEHNYLVQDQASFRKACRQAETDGVRCIAQAFIPNDGDYRVLVLGCRIELVIHRRRTQDTTHLNNTSQGAHAAIVPTSDLPTNVQTACISAAKLLERQVAGVDIVQDKKTGLWYCLEVNDGPQLASGSFTTDKHQAFAAYLERELTK